MAIPLIPIIMAVAALAKGVAQSIEIKNQTKEQMSAEAAQSQAAINERARQAKKLMSQQKTSFLKSGVYFEGTPQAVFEETYNTAVADINDLARDSETRQNTLIRQGKTAFYQTMSDSIFSAASSFMGMGGAAGASSGIQNTAVSNSVQNWYSGARGWNKGGFGGSEISGWTNA